MYNKTKIDINELIDKAARVYEVNVDDLMGRSRKRYIVDARRAIFYLLKTHYGISEFYTSKMIDFKRDHSTIMHLNETTDFLLKTDYGFSEKYKRYFEFVTKVEYLRPLPPEYKKFRKEEVIYKYYTDDMIARSKLRLHQKTAMLSSDYKTKVKLYMREYPVVIKAMNKFNISRDLLLRILAE